MAFSFSGGYGGAPSSFGRASAVDNKKDGESDDSDSDAESKAELKRRERLQFGGFGYGGGGASIIKDQPTLSFNAYYQTLNQFNQSYTNVPPDLDPMAIQRKLSQANGGGGGFGFLQPANATFGQYAQTVSGVLGQLLTAAGEESTDPSDSDQSIGDGADMFGGGGFGGGFGFGAASLNGPRTLKDLMEPRPKLLFDVTAGRARYEELKSRPPAPAAAASGSGGMKSESDSKDSKDSKSAKSDADSNSGSGSGRGGSGSGQKVDTSALIDAARKLMAKAPAPASSSADAKAAAPKSLAAPGGLSTDSGAGADASASAAEPSLLGDSSQHWNDKTFRFVPNHCLCCI